MGIRGELFTTEILGENRTYFFNVKENRKGDVFLQVVESKTSDGTKFDRQAVIVFENEIQSFLRGLEKSLDFIEKNRKKMPRQKKPPMMHSGKKRIIKKESKPQSFSKEKKKRIVVSKKIDE